jgi:opacity protein-like surface antigen
MNKFKKLGLVSVLFGVLFFLISLPQAQSAEATVPLAATSVTGAVEECPYTLTFKLAAVALHREDNKPESWGLIGAGGLDLGWAPGMDTSIILQRERFGVELRYLGLHQWSDKESASFSSAVAAFDIYQSAKFKSRLHNAELNLHWWPCICENGNDRFNLLAGFRWLRLTDTFSILQSLSGETSVVMEENLSCRNQFWGGQVGAEGLLYGKRDQGFSIDGVVKAGLFANDINNHVRGYSIPGGSGSIRWDRNKTSFIGEVGLNANYAFTKNIAMTLGYEFLYLNKVAVPVNNFGSTQSVIYNGARLGLNFVF